MGTRTRLCTQISGPVLVYVLKIGPISVTHMLTYTSLIYKNLTQTKYLLINDGFGSPLCSVFLVIQILLLLFQNNFLSILSRETFHCACSLMGQIKHSLCSSPSPTTYVLDFHNEAVKARMLMARNVFGETKEHIF